MAGFSVRIYAPLSDQMGLPKGLTPAVVDLPAEAGATLRAVLGQLTERYPALAAFVDPATGTLLGHVAVAVNGRLVEHDEEYEVPLRHGAEISLVPTYAGGAGWISPETCCEKY